jgi:hypothetical protein
MYTNVIMSHPVIKSNFNFNTKQRNMIEIKLTRIAAIHSYAFCKTTLIRLITTKTSRLNRRSTDLGVEHVDLFLFVNFNLIIFVAVWLTTKRLLKLVSHVYVGESGSHYVKTQNNTSTDYRVSLVTVNL